MIGNGSTSRNGTRQESRVVAGFVVFAMTAVAMALATALYLHVGLPAGTAFAAGSGALLAFLVLHRLRSRIARRRQIAAAASRFETVLQTNAPQPRSHAPETSALGGGQQPSAPSQQDFARIAAQIPLRPDALPQFAADTREAPPAARPARGGAAAGPPPGAAHPADRARADRSDAGNAPPQDLSWVQETLVRALERKENGRLNPAMPMPTPSQAFADFQPHPGPHAHTGPHAPTGLQAEMRREAPMPAPSRSRMGGDVPPPPPQRTVGQRGGEMRPRTESARSQQPPAAHAPTPQETPAKTPVFGRPGLPPQHAAVAPETPSPSARAARPELPTTRGPVEPAQREPVLPPLERAPAAPRERFVPAHAADPAPAATPPASAQTVAAETSRRTAPRAPAPTPEPPPARAQAPAPQAPTQPLSDAAAAAEPRPSRPRAETQPAARETAPAPARPAATGESMHDFWSYRPAAPKLELPPFVTGRISGGVKEPLNAKGGEEAAAPSATAAPATAPSAPPPIPAAAPTSPAPTAAAPATPAPAPAAAAAKPAAPPPATTPREADVELIQAAIKRLLEEVNAAEILQSASTNGSAAANSADSASVPGGVGAAAAAPQASQQPVTPAVAAPIPDAAIASSLEALRLTADTMRAASASKGTQTGAPLPPLTASAPAGAPATELARTLPAKTAALAEALAAGRIDVFLEPILGLAEQATRHYEVSIRLRGPNGEPLAAQTDGTDLKGTGLLPLFDCARVSRTAAVGRHLEERGKTTSIFSDLNGESLTDDRFLGDLAETVHQRASITGQLVLNFTQAGVRAFSAAEWDSIADMHALGFRFALCAITDLDMDFAALAENGFAFAKLDADVFLNGLPAQGGAIPASDICRHLARLGLTLVVENIDDETKLARIFGFGVLLGQGQLFGGPRPVRASAVAGRANAAA